MFFLFGHPLSRTYHMEVSRKYDVSEVAGKLLSVRNLDCLGRVLRQLESLCQLITQSPMSSLIPIMVSN
jgi:hypothetical protein